MALLKNGVIGAAFLALVAACSRRSTRSLLPKSLAGQPLVKVLVNGLEQKNMTEPRSGPEFTGYDNIVGFYGTGDRQIRLYYTRFPSAEEAKGSLADRAEALKSGLASEINGYQSFVKAGRTVHRFEGSGLVHFLFQRDNFNIWISAPPAIGDRVLAQLLHTNDR